MADDSSIEEDKTDALEESNRVCPRPRRATESAFSSHHAGRSKTCFRLALPPPRHRQRIRLRPKLILQVQQISHTTRPVPKLDVLPSAFFGTLFGLKAHYMLNVRFSRCGPADVVIVPSDSYVTTQSEDDGNHASGSDDESVHRELVAAITLPKKDYQPTGEICLAQGSRWDAISLPNGNYEFVSTSNGVKTVARWVLRRNRRSTVAGSPIHDDDKRSFTFSLIDPSTRRHPVVGWLDSKGVDVADRYSPTSEQANRRLDIAEVASDDLNEQPRSQSPEGKNLVEMDDFTRTLIIATSIYVSLREGWAKNEITSTPDISSSQFSPAPSQLPLASSLAYRANGTNKDAPFPIRRKQSYQFSSFFEKTSVAFRRSLSLSHRSSQPPSMRRAVEAENSSKLSSRRSSLLSESPNRSELRESMLQRRYATIPTSHYESASNTLLTCNDAGVDDTDIPESFHNDSMITSNHDESTADSQAVSSHTDFNMACSPSPDLSNRGPPPPSLFVKSGQQSTGRTKKWRKLGHWLKPLGALANVVRTQVAQIQKDLASVTLVSPFSWQPLYNFQVKVVEHSQSNTPAAGPAAGLDVAAGLHVETHLKLAGIGGLDTPNREWLLEFEEAYLAYCSEHRQAFEQQQDDRDSSGVDRHP
ncbi:hypothetical protein KEM54_003452 [Ascosphaera aggregata]|nr:hypothetical protein KEM54_003452 [Ascosphaera aggregata]